MADVSLTEGDYVNLRGAYGYLGVDPLTVQQEMCVLSHLRGMSIKASAQAAGMSPSAAYNLMKEDRIDVIKEFFRQQLFQHTVIELNMLNSMAMEAHRKSGTATEELKAVEVLAKLNQVGGFAPQQVIKDRLDRENRPEDITPKSAKELERMDETRLLELADLDGMESLDPQPVDRAQPDDVTIIEASDADIFVESFHTDEDVIEGEVIGESTP